MFLFGHSTYQAEAVCKNVFITSRGSFCLCHVSGGLTKLTDTKKLNLNGLFQSRISYEDDQLSTIKIRICGGFFHCA